VAQIYAGILGLLAFLTTLARGLAHNNNAEATLWNAWLFLMVFTVVGLVVGWIAGRVVEEAVTGRVEAELAAQEAEMNKLEAAKK
jgi:Na+/H+-dicarboxylate symporter